VREDQAAQAWNLHGIAGFFRGHVRNAEQDERERLARLIFPVAFDRSELCRLVLERVEAVQIADHCLDRRSG
jgi:hypothetical protein